MINMKEIATTNLGLFFQFVGMSTIGIAWLAFWLNKLNTIENKKPKRNIKRPVRKQRPTVQAKRSAFIEADVRGTKRSAFIDIA